MALLMGLQHAFSMVGGLITVPYVIFRFSVDFGNTELQQYAISASLICSGICSIIQVSKLYIPFSEEMFGRKLFIGSGLLSVMGTSFTFLPLFEIAIRQMKADGVDGETAYGRMLGTSMVCGLLELVFAFLPLNILKSIFPPVVTSITVMLIGVALTGTGMKYWGGGTVCAEMVWKVRVFCFVYLGCCHRLLWSSEMMRLIIYLFCTQNSYPCPSCIVSLKPKQEHSAVTALGDVDLGNPGSLCFNGDVAMGFGQAEFIGLGFSVMVMLVLIEIFGSVFMK